MLGWLIISFVTIMGLLFIGLAIKETEPGMGFVGFLALVGVCITLGVSYQYHISNIESRYAYYKQVAADTRALIDSDSTLNMKDIQMGQKLQESIKELRYFEQEVRTCRLSPFSIFKPTIILDDEVKNNK